MAFLALQQEVAAQSKMDLSDADQLDLIKRWINTMHKFVNSIDEWPWLFDRKVVQTETDSSLTAVSVASGGTTVTAAASSFVAGDVGKFIQFSTSNDWYKIIIHTSDTEVEIEAGYIADDALSAGTATMRKVYYSLGDDVDTIMTVKQAITPMKLEIIHHRKFDEDHPNIDTDGAPRQLHIWGYDSNNNYQFSLYPIPDEKMNLEIRYKKVTTDMTADTDEPNIPTKWADLILPDGALWLAWLYNRDSSQAKLFKAQFVEGVNGLKLKAFPESDSHPLMDSIESCSSDMEMKWPDEYGKI